MSMFINFLFLLGEPSETDVAGKTENDLSKSDSCPVASAQLFGTLIKSENILHREFLLLHYNMIEFLNKL